ncbi:NapC/NirT family cytochrome c [Bacillus sp. OK048]|uniref:cytochrome c3 family protein n=1 Tax=Bacillus sp. OK048 TaxID=1882761 RepID=UPI00088DF85B|nr:NapC/NirT family cytochrome c [Bacillus sp. OK048]SDM70787.1 Tetraheme cytochrome c subunit of nitrate or TMAO reductase [Bacillus sp. OK048]
MNEEKEQLSAPPRSRLRLYKFMTLTVLFLVLFFSLGAVGLEATSSSKFCASCHEMKPEYYTWKASSHSQVDCVNCHIKPGFKQTAKDKIGLIAKAVNKDDTQNVAPIRMPGEIPDSTCESCHNVLQRQFTVSGDIIIPHDKHKDEDVSCIQCHSGVAHGEIADREMTFKTDYDKWDSDLGIAAMADLKWTRPTMDTCMDCHESRQVTTECSACHTTGMLPKSHEEASFKTKTHGKQAKEELKDCNSCHKYMSSVEIEGYEGPSVLEKYIQADSGKVTKTERTYAKENTFCQDCHKIRPPSHEGSYFDDHGAQASKNGETCYTCHEPNRSNTSSSNTVDCSSCHQMKHLNKWREKHPVAVGNVTKPQESCYTCHVKKTCSSCHKSK